MSHDYDDIIDLPHFEPRRHLRMPAKERAAQFAPFAALTGFDKAINKTIASPTDNITTIMFNDTAGYPPDELLQFSEMPDNNI